MEAETVAKSLLDEGIIAIRIMPVLARKAARQAVQAKIAVGAVRFDFHPGLVLKVVMKYFANIMR